MAYSPAANRLARAKAAAASIRQAFVKQWPNGDECEYIIKQGDWRQHRKSLRIDGHGLSKHKDSDGLQWCEDPAGIGLRFVGFVDELARNKYAGRNRFDHSGWFTDSEFQSEVYRGAVYQFPARNGVARYVAGYCEGESHHKRGWTNNNGDSARLDLDIIEGDSGRTSPYDDESGLTDAMMRADSIAERAAEQEREYQDASRAAHHWQEAGDDMQQERASARQLVRDMRAAIKSGLEAAPSICDALRKQLAAHLAAWEEARDRRDKIDSDFNWRPNWPAPGQSVAQFAAANL